MQEDIACIICPLTHIMDKPCSLGLTLETQCVAVLHTFVFIMAVSPSNGVSNIDVLNVNRNEALGPKQ